LERQGQVAGDCGVEGKLPRWAAERGASIPFGVTLDGAAPGDSRGVDVDEQGNGVINEPRLYGLIRQPDRIEDRTFEITFLEPGAQAYVFTFG
jgi:hypothetical protein